jgi:hypothetical protein
MTTETVTIERYVVCKTQHLGPLRRDIRIDDIIEWQPQTETLKINGNRIDATQDVSPSEAMRMLRVLCERNPDEAPLKELEPPSDDEVQELKTSTLCVLPILGCLVAAQDFIGEKYLAPVSDEQNNFLEMFSDLMECIPSLSELESLADKESSVINKWLKDKGFDIQLPEAGDGGFAVASVLILMLKWIRDGKRTSITGQAGEEFVGVSMKKNVRVAHSPAVHPNPVVRIACKNGDTVCMSMVNSIPEGFAGLFLKVADLNKVKAYAHNYEGVHFPMIDLDDRPDISWIQGLEFSNGFFVGSAMQQTKFRMNEQGAKVESAAGMVMTKGMSSFKPQPHVINRPFLLWVNREGLDFPIFAALLCEDVWKEPEGL